MAKNTNRVASAIAYVAALGLAFGASAAHWELSTDNDPIFAAESMGDGTEELTLNVDLVDGAGDPANPVGVNEGTNVKLALVAPDGVGANSEVTITFTLTGAVFGNTVQISDFKSNDDDLDVVNGTKEGGRSGTDNTVSVRFKAGADLTGDKVSANSSGDATRPTITLNIEAIEGATGLTAPKASVTVGAEVELHGTTDSTATAGDFPIGNATAPGERDDATTADVSEHLDEDGDFKFKAADNKIASSVMGIEYTKMDGGTGQINIEDRTKLVGGSLVLGSVSSTVHATAWQPDGMNFGMNSGADANVNITVEGGNVMAGDTIYYNTDGKAGAVDKEKLSITGGVASGSFRVNHGSAPDVIYMPGEGNTLGRGDFTTTFRVVYDSGSVRDPGELMSSASLAYAGVDMKARAYAIPNMGNMDKGNVRIKCEVGGMLTCTTFLECDPQEGGEPLFGEVGEIAAGATKHLTSADVMDVLGEDWDMRLACDVLADRDVSVQVLVRSDMSLINNTYVDDMSAMTELADAVSGVMTAVGGVNTAVSGVNTVATNQLTVACAGNTNTDLDEICGTSN